MPPSNLRHLIAIATIENALEVFTGYPQFGRRLGVRNFHFLYSLGDRPFRREKNLLKDGMSWRSAKWSGSNEAFLVTYPDLAHECWDEAFSTSGLFQWLFNKHK